MKAFFKRLIKTWIFDILIVGGIITVILVVVYRSKISSYLPSFSIYINEGLAQLPSAVTKTINFFSLDIVLIILVIIFIIALFLWRIFWRLQRANIVKTSNCPKCDQPLVRIHRKPWQKIIGRILLTRRYYCKSCGWRGMRLKMDETDKHASMLYEMNVEKKLYVDKIDDQ